MTAAQVPEEVHGPDVDGGCRCGWRPGPEPWAMDEAELIAYRVDQRGRHYEAVGYEVPDLQPPEPRTVAPEGISRLDLSGAVERARRAHEAMTPPPPPPEPSPEVIEARRRQLADKHESVWDRDVPSRFSWARVENFGADLAGTVGGDVPLGPTLAEWGDQPARRNLVLTGATGVGKSHAAVAAARRSFDRGASVRFQPVVELLDQLRPGGPEGVIDDLVAVDVLILDDLGAERATDWTVERLYSIVNRRWLEELATIVTTNLDVPEPLQAAIGPRTYSRIVGNDAVVLRLGGPDRRRT